MCWSWRLGAVPQAVPVDSLALAALELRDFLGDAVTQALLDRRATSHRGNDRVRWPQLTAESSARVP
jgi:hypothetical protein